MTTFSLFIIVICCSQQNLPDIWRNLSEVFAVGHGQLQTLHLRFVCCSSSQDEGKKSASLFSDNFVNILCVFLNVICISFMESMLVNQNLQQSFQHFLVAVTLVEISRTFKDLCSPWSSRVNPATKHLYTNAAGLSTAFINREWVGRRRDGLNAIRN